MKSSNNLTSDKVARNHTSQEIYLECLGHLMGLQFQPKSGLKLKTRQDEDQVEPTDVVVDGSQTSQRQKPQESVTVKDLSVEKAKTWRPGAATAVLAKFGISCKSSNCRDTLDKYVIKLPELESNKSDAGKVNLEQGQKNGEGGALLGGGFRSIGLSRSVRSTFVCPIKRPVSGNQASSSSSNAEDDFTNKRPKLDPSVPTPTTSSSTYSNSATSKVVNAFFSSVPSKNVPTVENGHDPQVHSGRGVLNIRNQNDQNEPKPTTMFQSAYNKLVEEDRKKGINRNLPPPRAPVLSKRTTAQATMNNSDDENNASSNNQELAELMTHEKIKVFEPKIVESILSEVMEKQRPTDWDDIAGLKGPKDIIREIIIWPMLRPDIFKGLRASPKGILLFGPPGTGKTMIGRLIATQSNSTFFNISASSLTSKWIGDGEKMVRCLFQVARIKQPSVIFIDEIDSILSQRSDTEHESSRRMKTEFLIQFDGAGTNQEDKVLVIGVTNRPQELDEAARRRLVKRIYIPLPEIEGRKQIVKNLMQDQICSLTEDDIVQIATMSDGYSGADMKSLCQEASYGPIREIGHMLKNIVAANVRPIQLQDFTYALKRVKSSVGLKDLEVYEDWDEKFGCHVEMENGES